MAVDQDLVVTEATMVTDSTLQYDTYTLNSGLFGQKAHEFYDHDNRTSSNAASPQEMR